jgi:hypothetical protein
VVKTQVVGTIQYIEWLILTDSVQPSFIAGVYTSRSDTTYTRYTLSDMYTADHVRVAAHNSLTLCWIHRRRGGAGTPSAALGELLQYVLWDVTEYAQRARSSCRAANIGGGGGGGHCGSSRRPGLVAGRS